MGQVIRVSVIHFELGRLYTNPALQQWLQNGTCQLSLSITCQPDKIRWLLLQLLLTTVYDLMIRNRALNALVTAVQHYLHLLVYSISESKSQKSANQKGCNVSYGYSKSSIIIWLGPEKVHDNLKKNPSPWLLGSRYCEDLLVKNPEITWNFLSNPVLRGSR